MSNKQQYVVLDKHYSISEGQECFVGTLEECEEYKKEQVMYSKANEFMLEIHPIIELQKH